MQTIVITGGGGFIGSHLAERLCATTRIVILDNFRRDSLRFIPELAAHPNVRLVKADILDAAAVREAVSGADVVIHAAAIAGVSSYYSQPLDTLRVNIMGGANVLDAVAACGVKRYLGFSTSEVYGPDAFDAREEQGFRVGPVSDSRWTYAVSKIASENLALASARQFGFTAHMIRPFNIYGPRQTGEGCIANFMRAAVTGQQMTVHGDGSAIRSWCHVDDCVDALVTLLSRGDIESGSFNIGNPRETYSTLGLARLVRQVAGSGSPIVHEHIDRTDVRVRVPNIEKAAAAFGFAPKVDLPTGLAESLEAFRKELG